MACLCGDPMCPSCGPAQGICPKCYELELPECICDQQDYDEERYDEKVSDVAWEKVAANKPLII